MLTQLIFMFANLVKYKSNQALSNIGEKKGRREEGRGVGRGGGRRGEEEGGGGR